MPDIPKCQMVQLLIDYLLHLADCFQHHQRDLVAVPLPRLDSLLHSLSQFVPVVMDLPPHRADC